MTDGMNPQGAPAPQAAAPAPQPVYVPAPLMQLSGGMKFAWLVIGFLMGIPGLILAWLVNVDKVAQVKSDAVKFSVIGLVINIVLLILFSIMFGALMAAMVSSIGSSYYY